MTTIGEAMDEYEGGRDLLAQAHTHAVDLKCGRCLELLTTVVLTGPAPRLVDALRDHLAAGRAEVGNLERIGL
mgnify:CR=1 FL=1